MASTIAFVGDVHGHHDRMAASVAAWQERSGRAVDLIVSTGDFESFRDERDMRCSSCPPRHQALGDFPPYYRGEKRYPAPVLFIGGNHEAYNLLDQIPRGGAVAPGCHYLGRQGVAERLGLRIAGLTGIFSPAAYQRGRRPVDFAAPESLPRSVRKRPTYFTRQEVDALCDAGPVDVLVLHDWPEGLADLVVPGSGKVRPRAGVGNGPARGLLEVLQPRWLVCGHMHWYCRGDIRWPGGNLTTALCLDHALRPPPRHLAILHAEDGRDWQLSPE